MFRFILHYGFHVLLPLAIALIWFKPRVIKIYLIFLLGFLIDVDHLMANPIFSPNRCSINYHLLHSYVAIAIYVSMLLFKKTRLIAIGLVCHIVADSVDCLLIYLGY